MLLVAGLLTDPLWELTALLQTPWIKGERRRGGRGGRWKRKGSGKRKKEEDPPMYEVR